MTFWTYLLRCSDGSYYAGHTDALEQRIAQHQAGAIPGYTQARRPVALVWSQDFSSRIEALEAERRIKGWSRGKKEALIAGDWERVRALASRAALRDAASTGSAAPQDERSSPIPGVYFTSVRPEEGLSASEGPSRRTRPDALPSERALPVHLRRTEVESSLPTGDPVLSSVRAERSRSTSPAPPPVIVLVRPQLGENIGKAARAMLNFGLVDLRLVAPRDGWPNPQAGPAASGADVVLERATVFPSVAAATADCAHVFATTVRRRGVTKPVVTPEAAAAAIRGEAGRSAILFGPERSGLETDDVALARTIVTVPINPEFGSLNLAQAVILVAYEWSKGEALAQPPETELLPPAPQEELDGMIAQLDAMLERANYFFPPDRVTATRRTLRTMLTKPGWTTPEVRTMRGVLSALAGAKRPKP